VANRNSAPDLVPDAYSSRVRPAVFGQRVAVSAAHPLAASAALEVVAQGGGAADAVVAAQAVISVVAPEAGGLGGDGFFLVRRGDGDVIAVNAAGRSASASSGSVVADDGTSVTVPGAVAGWGELSMRFGKVPLGTALAPAIRIAEEGFMVRPETIRALAIQKPRLVRGGAEQWPLFGAQRDETVRLPSLAKALSGIGSFGARWFYEGHLGNAIAEAVIRQGGTLSSSDMKKHDSVVTEPLSLSWKGLRIYVQPPMSQGVLLLMALAGFDQLKLSASERDHAAIELAKATFAFRDEVSQGAALLANPLTVDLERASERAGPRSYLHTAGVAAADGDGLVVSSLISVFDDFGSAIYVRDGGFVLNNRAAGFTNAPNDYRPGALPIHTLAPILVDTGSACFALATPGADGQVQTLLQILIGLTVEGLDLPTAIDRARWRSEDGRLLVETGYPAAEEFAARGHEVLRVALGDTRFGAVVCAGLAKNRPFACSDWRRETWSVAG
jgi:gamma-glutamyltranspeptidase / glutathione hydrolase